MGPLDGIKVIEMRGIGPGPYAGMLLADMGAEVICIDRARKASGIAPPAQHQIHSRGKKSVAINLKSADGVATLLSLIEQSDMLIEGFRPGVMEKLGLSPEICHARNPKLIYGRITGWGQTGPLAKTAGHDLNFISLTGALAAIGPQDKPVPPLNLVGDYAGGSLFLVMGMLAALHVATLTGKGDVIDAAITDGSASLMGIVHTAYSLKGWMPSRESNLLDGGAHFYRCYETSDGKHLSIGSIEPQFYALLMEKAELDPEVFGQQMNPAQWADKGEMLSKVIKQKTRDQWNEIFADTDACVAPVLDFTEAPMHEHNKARATYIRLNGVAQPAPAPRFANHVAEQPKMSGSEGSDTKSVLSEFGFDEAELEALEQSGALP